MKFKGIIPALVTPLNEDETINTSVLVELINYLNSKGADGFYIGGATGEGLALRTEERMVLAQEAVNAINGKKPSIIQVASTDFNDAILLAKHAEKIGADAISATPPLFFQYDENDVYNYYKALADSVHIPVMIYYSPAARFDISADFAAKMFEVDNITAIKWTSSDYYEMLRLKDLTHGEMNIINGPDEMLLMGLNAGADGGIGTTYNFMFETIKSIYDNFIKNNPEEAQRYQTLANRIIAELKKYHTIPLTKVILEEMGFNVGNATFPMKRYTDKEKQAIISGMRSAGLKI
jgi:N-acetylneuraminate lyase